MFTTKIFSGGDVARGLLDAWLDSLNTPTQGMMVVGYSTVSAYQIAEVYVTVKTWKRSVEEFRRGERGTLAPTTIDEIPQEPTIDYGTETVADVFGRKNEGPTV